MDGVSALEKCIRLAELRGGWEVATEAKHELATFHRDAEIAKGDAALALALIDRSNALVWIIENCRRDVRHQWELTDQALELAMPEKERRAFKAIDAALAAKQGGW